MGAAPSDFDGTNWGCRRCQIVSLSSTGSIAAKELSFVIRLAIGWREIRFSSCRLMSQCCSVRDRSAVGNRATVWIYVQRPGHIIQMRSTIVNSNRALRLWTVESCRHATQLVTSWFGASVRSWMESKLFIVRRQSSVAAAALNSLLCFQWCARFDMRSSSLTDGCSFVIQQAFIHSSFQTILLQNLNIILLIHYLD